MVTVGEMVRMGFVISSISTHLRSNKWRILVGVVVLAGLGIGEWQWAAGVNRAAMAAPPSISAREALPPEVVQMIWFHTLPELSLLTKTGSHRINSGAVEVTGIRPDQLAAAQQAVDQEVERMEKWVVDHAEFNAAASDPPRGILVYDIKAMEDRGESFRQQLKADLVAAAGPFEGRTLFDMMDRSRNYGGYGQYDVTITFSKSGGSVVSQAVCTDPATGKMALSMGAVMDSFREWWGKTFDTKLPP